MMEMDDRDSAMCQKSKIKDMDVINRIVNDNGTKDEQYSSPSKHQKPAVSSKTRCSMLKVRFF